MLATNWSDYFKSRTDNDKGNQNTTIYHSAWNPSVSNTVKLSLLTNDPDTIILAADAEGTIIPLHSFANLGGSLLHRDDKFVCLIGSGQVGIAVIVAANTATADCNFFSPTVDVIIAAKTTTDLHAIIGPTSDTNGDTDGTTYLGCSTFLPAPWLVDAILETKSNDPWELILAASVSATAFDLSHDSDPTYLTTAKSHLEDFVQWAWGVKMQKVPRIDYRLDPTDAALEAFQKERQNKCISPSLPSGTFGHPPVPPPGPPPMFAPPGTAPTTNEAVLQQLAASISRQSDEAKTQNELLTRQLEHTLEKDEKKKDRFKKLHSSTKQLILFASADDADDVPPEVVDSCKRFINAETTGIAEQELNLQFKNLGLQDAAFSPGLTQALYAGKFIWADKSTPSNFSPFSFFEVEPLAIAEQQNRHLILHLVETQGKGKTLDEIKASNKQEVKAPTTYLEMTHQLSFFAGACSIFFGENSIPCQAVTALVTLVERNRHILKAREADKKFMSQFLFAVDTRFQLWLDECMTLTCRSQVDDSMLNFTQLIEHVRFGTFFVQLPSTFIAATDAEPKSGTSGKNLNKRQAEKRDEEEATNKKKKRKPTKVDNSSQPESCKLQTGETWATHFANKGFNDRVDWNGDCKMCPRWFIRGFCFADCTNKDSHVKAEEVPSDKLTAFQQFMRTCRGST
jgi:hypothetical protein